MNQLVRYFFRGLLVLVPASATVALLWFLLVKVDRWIGAPIDRWIGLPLPVPGTGLLLLLLGTVVIGVLASNFVTRKAFEVVERIFERVPLVKMLYSSIRDLTNAFVGEKKSFDKPVLVTLGEGQQAGFLGFATRESLEVLGLPDHVAVYFPQSYNFAGNTLVVPRAWVRPLAAPSADVLAFIVSAGVSGLPDVSKMPPA